MRAETELVGRVMALAGGRWGRWDRGGRAGGEGKSGRNGLGGPRVMGVVRPCLLLERGDPC